MKGLALSTGLLVTGERMSFGLSVTGERMSTEYWFVIYRCKDEHLVLVCQLLVKG